MSKIPGDINKLRYIAAAAVFVVSFTVYCFTMAPTVTLVDSGELILASVKLGVPHPPGFPLYVMLAHIASLVPVGNPAVRIHMASALFAALAAAVMTLLAIELMLMPASTTIDWALMPLERGLRRKAATFAASCVSTASFRGMICSA